jgi:hypothetical protein
MNVVIRDTKTSAVTRSYDRFEGRIIMMAQSEPSLSLLVDVSPRPARTNGAALLGSERDRPEAGVHAFVLYAHLRPPHSRSKPRKWPHGAEGWRAGSRVR